MEKTLRLLKQSKLICSLSAIVLSIAILLSAVAALPAMAQTGSDSDVWTGGTSQPADGNGSEATPWLITNADELAWAMQSGGNGEHYKLTDDIYLNKVDGVSWSDGVATSGYTVKKWTPAAFSGTIDGDGHVIYGLYSTDKNDTPGYWSGETHIAGFIKEIAATGSVTITGLGFDNFYIDSTNLAGIFVSKATKGAKLSVSECYIGANGKLSANYGAPFIAYAKGSTSSDYYITNCYSLLTNYYCEAGYAFVGGSWGTFHITNCYSLGKMHYNGPYTNCYSADTADEGNSGITVRDITDMQGEAAVEAMPLGSAFAYTATYPALKKFPHEALKITQYWTGGTSQPADGNGSEATPWLITNADELAWAMQSGGNGEHYKLTDDIYLNKVDGVSWSDGVATSGYTVKKWTPAAFSGTIDGDGHVIYGLYSTDKNATPGYWSGTTYNAGFIKEITSTGSVTITGLGFDNFYLDSTNIAGIFVAKAASGAKLSISECYVGANGKINANYGAPFIAYGQGTSTSSDYYITNCYSLHTNYSCEARYSFIGGSWGTYNITNCYSLSHLYRNGPYTNCYSADTADEGNSGITVRDITDMQGAYALENMPLGDAFVATESYPKLEMFVVQRVKSEGAQTYGKNLRFLMSYKGLASDGNTVVIDNKLHTVTERGFIIKGQGVTSNLMVDSNEKGVIKIRKTDLSDNWSFDSTTGTTVYSLNISGFKKDDTYKVSARGYIILSDGTTHYSNILTTCVDEVPNQNIIDNKPYVPNTVTLTLYDADSYGVTWQTEKMPEKAVVQVSKGSSFDEENYTEFEASTSAEQSYDINNALYTYYVSKAVITGLKPNTTYTYRCYDALVGVPGEEFTFTTRDRSASSFKFVHVSDSQTNASSSSSPNGAGTGVYYANTMKGVELNNFDAEFILHSGDIVEWSKYESYWTSMIGDNAKYFAEIPVMAIAGNHEATYRNGDRELYKHFNYKIHEQDVSKGFSYSFDYGNTKFIMLDTNNLTSDRVLSDDVYTWLEETLENNQQKWTIVTMHHPMYSVGKYGSDTSLNATSLALRAQLSNLFAENGVDLVIQGHDHTLSKTYPIGMNGAINNNLTYETINGTDYCTNANGVVYVMHGASGNQTRWPYDTVETQYYEEYSNSETSTWAEFEITENLLTVKVYSYNSGTPKLLMNYGIKK